MDVASVPVSLVDAHCCLAQSDLLLGYGMFFLLYTLIVLMIPGCVCAYLLTDVCVCVCEWCAIPGILRCSSCPFVWHGYSNEHSRIACTNMNNTNFGGRRIFEWHDNGTLWIYPENRYDTVVSVQPTVGGGGVSSASAVYVQEAYYVSPQQPGSNVTVVAATVSPLTQEQQPYQPHTVANTSYQPPTTAYAPATRDTPTNHSDV